VISFLEKYKNGLKVVDLVGGAHPAWLPMKNIRKLLDCRIFLLLFFTFLYGCVQNGSGESELLNKEVLMSEMKVGEVMPFGRISNFREGKICILYPYQFDVSPKNYAGEDDINKYLETIKAGDREGLWSVVFVHDEQVKIRTLRVGQIDIARVPPGASSPLQAPDGPIYDPSNPPVEGGGGAKNFNGGSASEPGSDQPPWIDVSNTFEPMSYCADVNRAAFFKYQFRGRNYLVFGRIK